MNTDALCRAIRGFESYAQNVDENFLAPRQRLFKSLPPKQQEILLPLQNFKRQRSMKALANNSGLARKIAKHARETFGCRGGRCDHFNERLLSEATKPRHEDHAIVRGVIRQIWRDWSNEARYERNACYKPILEEINRLCGDRSPETINILIPGCGLGRLAWEIANAGYIVEANDVSYITLLANNFILSCSQSRAENEYVVCPWITQFSNHEHTTRQFAEYKIPDAFFRNSSEQLVAQSSDEMQFTTSFTKHDGVLMMNDKDFTKDFVSQEHKNRFDVIATCFFVDTAKNLLEYIDVIKHILKPGGVWINVGPLLWNCYENGPGGRREGDVDVDEDQRARQHPLNRSVAAEWDEKLEFSLEEVLKIIERVGMNIVRTQFVETAGYVMDVESLLQAKYRLAFWVARNESAQVDQSGPAICHMNGL